MSVSLSTTEQVNGTVRMARKCGLDVERDDDAGTIKIRDGEEECFWAIQKSRGGPWICRFITTANVTWSTNATSAERQS